MVTESVLPVGLPPLKDLAQHRREQTVQGRGVHHGGFEPAITAQPRHLHAHAARRHAVQHDWRAVLPQLLHRYLALLGRQAGTAAATFEPARERVRALRSR